MWQCLETFFDCHKPGAEPIGFWWVEKPGMLLSILQCRGQHRPPQKRTIQPKIITAPRLRNPVKNYDL